MHVENLTPVERLTLMNQFRLLALADEEESASYLSKIEVLENGWTGEYHRLFENFSDEKSAFLSSELHSILTMYRIIDNSVAKLKNEEKDNLELDRIAFDGFDANTDEHYGLMTFWINDVGLYSEYQGTYFNSHSQWSLEKYRKMLSVFTELSREGKVTDYSVSDLRRFIDRAR